ncbi:MAG: zinc ribbon domain-containing protein [Clostridia bacterium]|nr:zinc ribbon domain-containing protein [Clostridia bacterium]
MALIKCPECGKEVSDKAQSCINCGCPIGSGSSVSTLRVECKTLQVFGGCSIVIEFNGEKKAIKNGYYLDFNVPVDGKSRTAKIYCSKGAAAGIITITVHSGESKKVTVWYDNTGFWGGKWRYREEMFITR